MSELSERLRYIETVLREETGRARGMQAKQFAATRKIIGDALVRAADALDAQSKLLAEAREALEPFYRTDRAIGAEPGPFRFETGTGYRDLERNDLARAREVYTKLTEASK